MTAKNNYDLVLSLINKDGSEEKIKIYGVTWPLPVQGSFINVMYGGYRVDSVELSYDPADPENEGSDELSLWVGVRATELKGYQGP